MIKVGDRVTYIGELSEHVGRSGNVVALKNGDIGMKTDNYYSPKKNMIWEKEKDFKIVSSNKRHQGSLEEIYRQESLNSNHNGFNGLKEADYNG